MIDEKNVLNDEVMRSEMLTKLLLYILIHRERSVSVHELEDALWQDGETDNPSGALKNLMYRLRIILQKTFGSQKFIITSRGFYRWNQEVEVIFDAEEFEQNINKAKKSEGTEDKIAFYRQAMKLYKGDFMSKVLDSHWVVMLSAYYHSIYLTATKSLSQLYIQKSNFEAVERICTNTLKFDQTDEQLYCYLIEALMHQKKQKLAMEYYENAIKALHSQLGVRNPVKLKGLYKELIKMSKTASEENIENAQQDMVEEKAEGAFLCGYPVFKEVYRLEARKMSRFEETEYMVLLTIKAEREVDFAGGQMKKTYYINRAMDQLEKILFEELRIGDVVARYSNVQYVALLPTCTYENILLVINRILSKFHELNRKKGLSVKADFEKVTMSASLLVK